MKSSIKYLLITLAAIFMLPVEAGACTSMLVSASASATGKPLMWKHRDSDAQETFIDRVEAQGGKLGYVGLFNAGDSLHREAWMGMNDAGFAIMNTASYNVQPDTAKIKDREGIIMAYALQTCRTVSDFEDLLKRFKKPMGVQANFGVMDARGGLCYFEVNDHAYKRYDVSASKDGYLIRTNFSVAGERGKGKGYIRYNNLGKILKSEIEAKAISPESLTEKASRSFYNSVLDKDMAADTCKWVIDQDFIPRNISSSSIVIEGVNPSEPVNQMIMWTMLGYPPCSMVMPVTLHAIPQELRPTEPGYKSPFSTRMLSLKQKIFPLTIDNGDKYIHMEVLRPMIENAHNGSMKIYENVRNKE